jgi:hypothetical protein
MVKNNMLNLMTKQPNMLETIKNSIPPELPPKVATQYKKEFPMQKNEPLQSSTIELQKQGNDISLVQNSTIQPDNVQATTIQKVSPELEKILPETALTKNTTTRTEVNKGYRELAKDRIKNIASWKDKSNGYAYKLETFERNLEDITPDTKEGKLLNDTYFEPTETAMSNRNKFVNMLNDRVNALDLNDTESEYVFKLSEARDNPDTTLDIKQILQEIKDKKLDIDKLNKSINVFKDIFDMSYELENNTMANYGYKEKAYRKGYLPHYQENSPTSLMGKIGKALGYDLSGTEIPTSIAGMTDDFKPGKTWNSSMLRRTTDVTGYNVKKAYDKYIAQAADNIFLTEPIQKLRAFSNEIRYIYSEKGIQERFDEIVKDKVLDQEEKEVLIEKLFEQVKNPMPNLVQEIDRYTNILANKKSSADRRMEENLGRKMYPLIQQGQNHFASNAVGGNLASALNNFIPITQMTSEVNEKYIQRAMIDSYKNLTENDGFEDLSTFLTNRLYTPKPTYMSLTDKVVDTTSIPFEKVDSYTSNVVVRGKYYQNLDEGMTEAEAMKDADKFARRLISGRSKGNAPTIFNEKNPVSKIFTTFQLEVNNQFRYWAKDLPKNIRAKIEAKGIKGEKAKTEFIKLMATGLLKYSLYAWLFNDGFEFVFGRRPAFDPIDLTANTIATIMNKELNTWEKIKSVGKDIGQELPFAGGLLGGGRIPISSAFPDFDNLGKSTVGLFTGEMDKKAALSNIGAELSTPLLYFGNPFGGGGQIKKSAEGLKTIANQGEYKTNSKGEQQLKFPVDMKNMSNFERAGRTLQAVIGGKYALPTAQDWINNGFDTLTPAQTKRYQEALKQGYTAKQFYEQLRRERALNKLRRQK